MPSEEEYFEPTPPPQKSFVNKSRGNPRFGGPAASLMNHIGWRYSMHTIQGDESNDGIEREDEDYSSLVESVRDDEELPVDEVTVNIACICGNNLMTSSQVIQCDNCTIWFHTDCMELTISSIEEIVGYELDWFCKGCIEEASNNPDKMKNFTLTTPCKQEIKVHEEPSISVAPVSIGAGAASISSPPEPCSSLSEELPQDYSASLQLFPSSVIYSPSSVNPSVDMTPPANSIESPPKESLSFKQELPSDLSSCSRISRSSVVSSPFTVIPIVDPMSPPPSSIISPPNTLVMVSPTTSPTSVLSLTAQLESHHLAHSDSVQDASLLFVKPTAPPKLKRKQVMKISPTPIEDDLQLLKAGKSWRRSLTLAKRSSSNIAAPRPRPILP